MFRKRPHELTVGDLQAVVDETWLESAEVEFKADLPSNKGADPWILDQSAIGNKARNELLAEVIAFANAHGGHLILGIEEAAGKPAKAAAIRPLPACADLAERLLHQCRDCIEPQVPMIEVAGIATEPDGAGVVVFRVPQSRLAPHRHEQTRECYMRRADRTEKMTMREIQDLTLQVERGLAAIDKAFQERREAFGKLVDNPNLAPDPILGIRVTQMLLVPLNVDPVHENPAVRAPARNIGATLGTNRYTFSGLGGSVLWRPILRGTRAADQDSGEGFAREVHCNGVIEYVLFRNLSTLVQYDFHALSPEWLMSMVANALCAVELFRKAAGAAEVEFGMEVEMLLLRGDIQIVGYGQNAPMFREAGRFPEGQTLLPRYSVGPPDEFPKLAALVERDFWEAAGKVQNAPIQVDFNSALADLKS